MKIEWKNKNTKVVAAILAPIILAAICFYGHAVYRDVTWKPMCTPSSWGAMKPYPESQTFWEWVFNIPSKTSKDRGCIQGDGSPGPSDIHRVCSPLKPSPDWDPQIDFSLIEKANVVFVGRVEKTWGEGWSQLTPWATFHVLKAVKGVEADATVKKQYWSYCPLQLNELKPGSVWLWFETDGYLLRPTAGYLPARSVINEIKKKFSFDLETLPPPQTAKPHSP